MIKYKFEGRAAGVETVYFDDYGMLTSTFKTIYSELNNKSTCTIIKHDTIFELNINNHTIMANCLSDNFSGTKQNIISNEALVVLGFFKSGVDIVAGKNCDKFSGNSGTLWVWNNIVLKSEMNILDKVTITEASYVEMGIEISKSKFEIPKDYKIINQ